MSAAFHWARAASERLGKCKRVAYRVVRFPPLTGLGPGGGKTFFAERLAQRTQTRLPARFDPGPPNQTQALPGGAGGCGHAHRRLT